MNLKRWCSLIPMAGLILALSAVSLQAEPYPPYYHPHGNAYGWEGPRHYGFDHHPRQFRRVCKGPHNPRYVERVYAAPPPVAYVAPVAPVVGIPYAPPQPYYSQRPAPGFSGQLQYNF